MMQKVFVDTGGWYAAAARKDRDHAAAKQFLSGKISADDGLNFGGVLGDQGKQGGGFRCGGLHLLFSGNVEIKQNIHEQT